MRINIGVNGNRSFKISTRGHEFFTDLPVSSGGLDKAPTPSEVFIGSIGACMALYALRYLETAKLDTRGLSVEVDWDYDQTKTKIGRIDAVIKAPNTAVGARKKAVIAAAEKCFLHNTIHDFPAITTSFEGE